MTDAVIVATARSPIGRALKGSLRETRPDDLLAQMVSAALSQVPALATTDIDDMMVGCVQPGGEADFNIARIVSVLLDMDHLPGTTVNRACSSSLQTTRMAMHAIRAGEGEAFISGGVESVSRYPSHYLDNSVAVPHPRFVAAAERNEARLASGQEWIDPREFGALPDAYVSMLRTAENVAQLKKVSRRDQDEYAVRSQNRAETALANGFWALDITPVTAADGSLISADDGPRPGVTLDMVSALQPVLGPTGTVTAGNCCPLNDGAAAVVVMSADKARNLGLTPLARIVSTAVSGLSPEIMGLGPVEASRRALDRAGLDLGDIDLVEINEAFASQVLASARELGLDMDRLNVNGGAIAVGHPFGMTGARITSTLINALRFHDKQFGLETMCVGGGQGMAMVIERLS